MLKSSHYENFSICARDKCLCSCSAFDNWLFCQPHPKLDALFNSLKFPILTIIAYLIGGVLAYIT